MNVTAPKGLLSQPLFMEDDGMPNESLFSYEHKYGSFTCDVVLSDISTDVWQSASLFVSFAYCLSGIAAFSILLLMLRTISSRNRKVTSKVLKVQKQRISRSMFTKGRIRHQTIFLLWLLSTHYVEAHWREIHMQTDLRQQYEEDHPYLFHRKGIDMNSGFAESWDLGIPGLFLLKNIEFIHPRPPEVDEHSTQTQIIERQFEDTLFASPPQMTTEGISFFQRELDLSASSGFNYFPFQPMEEMHRAPFGLSGAQLLPYIRELLVPVLTSQAHELWSLYALDARGEEIITLKSQAWPSAQSLEGVLSLFNGIEFWFLGEFSADSLALCSSVAYNHLHLVVFFPTDIEVPYVARISRHTHLGLFYHGSFVKIWQRERAPEDSDLSSEVPSTPSASILQDLPELIDNVEEEDDYCTLFQRTFVGSHHEGLDWAERDIPRGEWANRMEQTFLADTQYVRQQIVLQPGVKFIRITRLHVNLAWPASTLSWEVNQASPLRIMRDINEQWPDVQGDWKLHPIDTTASALYALEELVLILELPNLDWDADRRLPHLLERIAIQGSTIKVNAVAKILESPTNKRDIISIAEMVGCSHLYACEVWVHGKRLLTPDPIWLHIPTLVQVVRTLGGDDTPLLNNGEELSIPSGSIRFWPSPFYTVLRQYGHPWKIMVFRDSSRAIPPEMEQMLQIFQQTETLMAHCFNTWPTLRIADWRSLSVDDSAYSSEALRDVDALYLIVELHTEVSWRLVLLERLIETPDYNEIQVVAHRMSPPIKKTDLIFSLDAETICAQPDKDCQTECNGQTLLEGGHHNAADGDFCRLHITSRPLAICQKESKVVNADHPPGARDRSRSPLKRHLSKTLYRSASDSGPHFSSARHRSHTLSGTFIQSDMHSLMQRSSYPLLAVPAIRSPIWHYVFIYGKSDPHRIWGANQGEMDLEVFIRNEITDYRPPTPSIEVMVRKVLPQPADLAVVSICAFVAVDFAELGPYLMPILIDIWWVPNLREAPQQPLSLWRNTKLVQYRSDRISMIDSVGLTRPCNVVPEACRVRHRGLTWAPNLHEIRRFPEGDLVEVWIHSPFPELSIIGQWQCLQEGCELRDFPRHIRGNVHVRTNDTGAEEGAEESSFMQVTRAAPTRWFYVYQRGTGDPYAFLLTSEEARSPFTIIERRLCEQVDSWSSSPGILAPIAPLPPDLLRDGIAAVVMHETSAPAGCSTVLVDVDILDASWSLRDPSMSAVDGWRETCTLPSSLTRQQFIETIEITEHCDEHVRTCDITLRGVTWPRDDFLAATITNGDFIWVQIHPITEDSRCPNSDWTSRQQGRLLDGGDDTVLTDVEAQILLQVDTRITRNRSLSELGWSHLPPPGNGNRFLEGLCQENEHVRNGFTCALLSSLERTTSLKKKKVSFNTEVELIEIEQLDFGNVDFPEDTAGRNRFLVDYASSLARSSNRFIVECRRRCLESESHQEVNIWTPSGLVVNVAVSAMLTSLSKDFKIHKTWLQEGWQHYVVDSTSQVVPVFFYADGVLHCHYAAKLSKFWEIDSSIDWSERSLWLIRSAGQYLGSFSRTDDLLPYTLVPFQSVQEAANHVCALTLPHVDTSQVVWHDSTVQAFKEVPAWDLAQGLCDHYALFTDGSTGQTSHGSAAVVLLGQWHGQWYWLGALALADPGQNRSGRMETLAIQLALVWTIQIVLLHRSSRILLPTIKFGYDSMVAGFTAAGLWNAHANTDLQSWNRALVYWLQAILPPSSMSWEHIPSHRGHAWNEAADTVASLAANGTIKAGSIEEWELRAALSTWENSLQWVWTLEDSHFQPILRQLQGNLFLCFPLPTQTMLRPPQHPFQRLSTTSVPIGVQEKQCKMASANVLTLFPDKQGEPWTGSFASARLDSLVAMFQAEDYVVVGIQESRMKFEGYRDLGDWHLLAGSSTPQGHGGTQLCIRKKWPTNSQMIEIGTSHLRILHAASNLLIVRFAPPGLRLLLIVGHAPSAANDTEARLFWGMVTRNIPPAYKTWRWIGFFDANARLGSQPSHQVGPLDAEPENAAGRWFHEWLHTNSIVLPATFEEYHVGQSWTWVHSNGTSKSRLDYIGVSSALSPQVIRTFVDVRIDLAVSRPDHAPTSLVIDLWFEATSPAKDALRKVDTSTLQSQLQADILSGNGQSWTSLLPTVSWNMDVHDHAALLNDGTQQVLRWFPRTARTPRKKHLSASTWELISIKRELWQALCITQRALKRDFIFLFFKAWKKGCFEGQHSLGWLQWREASITFHYRKYCRLVTTGVRKDDSAYYESLASKAGEADGTRHHSSLWTAIKAVLPKQIQRRKNSTTCQTPSTQALHDHFDHLEAGEPITYEALLKQCRADQRNLQDDIPLQIPLESLPTRLEVERLCKRVHIQKSPGIDGVPQAWLKYGCPLIAESLHALLLKCWVSGQEPLQFKGGLLHPLWKKGSKEEASNYRGITLLETYGKRWHALLRARLLQRAQSIRLTGQLGGFPRQQTGFASLYLRSFAEITAWKRFSEAVIFFDIRGAFHHLLRELAFDPSREFPPFLAATLEKEHIPWHELHGLVKDGDMEWLEGDSGLHRAICDAHRCTWTHFQGDPSSLRQTHRGTRPGSPLADLAFNCLMSRVLSKIQEELDNDQELQQFVQHTSFKMYTLAWVDDIAIPLAVSDNDLLVSKVRHYTLKVQKIMLSLGFTLNMDKGKTEAVLTFRGRGAPQKRRELYLQKEASISLNSSSAIHIVSDYKHLGARFSQHARFDREISIRIAEAQSAFRTLRKHIMVNRRISVPSRLRLLESLVISKLLFNSGYWPPLKPAQLHRLEGCITKWQRTITGDGFWATHRVSNPLFLKLHELPSIEARLNRNRLLSAFQVYQNSPDLAWPAAIEAEKAPSVTWLCMVRRAIEWLQDIDPGFGPLLPTVCRADELEHWLCASQDKGPLQVKRLFGRHLLQEKAIAEALLHHQWLHLDFENNGFRFKATIPESENFAMGLETFSCQACDKSFATRQALQAHNWLQHQQISIERQYVDGPVCRACGVMFWTSQRVQQHLRQSRKLPEGCFQKLFLNFQPCSEPVRWNIQSPWLHLHNLPQTYVGGESEGLTSNAEQLRQQQLDKWSQVWHEQGYPEEIPQDLYTCFREGIDCATFAWLCDDTGDLIHNWGAFFDRFARTHHCTTQMLEWCFYVWFRFDLEDDINQAAQRLQNQVIEDASALLASYPIQTLLHMLVDINQGRLEPPPLPETGPSAKGSHARIDGQVTHWYSRQAELMYRFTHAVVDHRPSLPPVPFLVDPHGNRCLVITHLFAGRRRDFDCHYWLEALASTYLPGWKLIILSFDTAIHPILGNLDVGANWTKVMKLASLQVVAANLTGPPCETYSAARHLPPPEVPYGRTRWPRPLRHPLRLWGLDGLSHRELRQLHMGTRLLMHSVRFETSVVLGGGGSVMEHPAPRVTPEIPSSWGSPALQKYTSHLEAKMHYIEQYKFGAQGVKPTTLRSLNLPKFGDLRQMEDGSIPRPVHGLQGLDETGTWKTAHAKEYPAALNKGLAIGVLSSLRHRLDRHQMRERGWAVIDELLPWVEDVARTSQDTRGAHFLPDYQGR